MNFTDDELREIFEIVENRDPYRHIKVKILKYFADKRMKEKEEA
jgi:hypothetical protein